MGFSTVISLVGLLGVALVYGACPPGWKGHGAKCYKFSLEILNWSEAREEYNQNGYVVGDALFGNIGVGASMCRWHKSDLIAIETQSEQDWFVQQILKFNQTNVDDGFWLGATDWLKTNAWVWESANGIPITDGFVAWGTNNPPQPNDRNGTEDCLASMKYFDYKWSDEWCDWERIGYVCEKPNTADVVVG